MAKSGKKTKAGSGSAKGAQRQGSCDRGRGEHPAEEATAAEVADGSADTSFTVALRAGQGFVLSALDPRSTPGFSGGKAGAAALMASTDHELDDLQERLYAESRTGGNRAILLVVQGMDTSGKGGIMRHVVGSVDPQGVRYTAFKAPDRAGEGPPVPVADPQRAAAPGPDRGVRPFALRGRADRPGARPGAAGDVEPAATRQINTFEARCRRRRARPSSR